MKAKGYVYKNSNGAYLKFPKLFKSIYFVLGDKDDADLEEDGMFVSALAAADVTRITFKGYWEKKDSQDTFVLFSFSCWNWLNERVEEGIDNFYRKMEWKYGGFKEYSKKCMLRLIGK